MDTELFTYDSICAAKKALLQTERSVLAACTAEKAAKHLQRWVNRLSYFSKLNLNSRSSLACRKMILEINSLLMASTWYKDILGERN